MKLNCKVIQDLLPLYVDKICSDESRELVDEHLEQCNNCSVLLQKMISTEIESDLKSETEDVIRNQANFFKRKSAVVGTVISGIFMIPVLVCLIVNLATGAALDWFFIVLASLINAASLIIIPLMMPEHKLFWTFSTFTLSLLLLLGVICIYIGGDWFFLVSSSVLFGFSVCFLPFVVCAEPLKGLLGRQKGLTVITAITVLYILMMYSIGLYVDSYGYWQLSVAISTPFLVLLWILFVLFRYLRINGLTKAGICTIIVGIFEFITDKLISIWIGIERPMPVFRPLIWNAHTVDGNSKWLLLITCTFVGIVLLIAGIAKSRVRT